MSNSSQKEFEVTLTFPERLPPRSRKSLSVGRISYSVVTGAVATVIGAAVSLVASATERAIVWCLVTLAVCIIAGIAWESGPVTSGWKACCRWLRELASS